MTEIEELLAKLKELDPETWSRVDKVLGLVVYPRSPLGHYIIQGVIQDAIVARGWTFSLDRVDGHYTAYIWDERDRGLSADSCDTPAEVILVAYIAALEAEREAMTDG